MAANTKYQAAPQRDSFDEGDYTQAPPSYQAQAASGPSNNDNVFGSPRSEDDNIPDDFKVPEPSDRSKCQVWLTSRQFGGSVAEATLPIRMQFVRKVYSILYVLFLFHNVESFL